MGKREVQITGMDELLVVQLEEDGGCSVNVADENSLGLSFKLKT